MLTSLHINSREITMTPFIRLTLLSLCLSTATATLAQETASEDTGATTEEQATSAEESTAEDALDLSMGEEVVETPAIGAPYVRETFGDWAMRCLKAEEGQPDPCQLYQLLNDENGNSVAEISLFPLENGGQAVAGATIVAPLETLLTKQLEMDVDGNTRRRYPFTFCNRAGCVARVGFTAEEVAQFKRGNAATLRMVPAAAPDEVVVLNISLSGFTAGYTAAEQ